MIKMEKVKIIKHHPSNDEYYKLFVGTHLRESIEKEIIKFSHRLEHGKYEIELNPSTLSISPESDGTLNIEKNYSTLNLIFDKKDFSKASLKILNHFAHDHIGSMWETTPSHVMLFDLLINKNNSKIVMCNSIMNDEIIQIDNNLIFTFSSDTVIESEI